MEMPSCMPIKHAQWNMTDFDIVVICGAETNREREDAYLLG